MHDTYNNVLQYSHPSFTRSCEIGYHCCESQWLAPKFAHHGRARFFAPVIWPAPATILFYLQWPFDFLPAISTKQKMKVPRCVTMASVLVGAAAIDCEFAPLFGFLLFSGRLSPVSWLSTESTEGRLPSTLGQCSFRWWTNSNLWRIDDSCLDMSGYYDGGDALLFNSTNVASLAPCALLNYSCNDTIVEYNSTTEPAPSYCQPFLWELMVNSTLAENISGLMSIPVVPMPNLSTLRDKSLIPTLTTTLILSQSTLWISRVWNFQTWLTSRNHSRSNMPTNWKAWVCQNLHKSGAYGSISLASIHRQLIFLFRAC